MDEGGSENINGAKAKEKEKNVDKRQQYIPVSRAKVKKAIFQLEGINDDTRDGLAKVSEMLEAIWHHSSHAGAENLKSLYESMDPDQIDTPGCKGKEEFLDTLAEALIDGIGKKSVTRRCRMRWKVKMCLQSVLMLDSMNL